MDKIFDYIDVKPPYFALEDLRLNDDDSLSATIPVQQSLGLESGYICAAESSQHLALLGACCIAIKNPIKKKHYYLTQQALFLNMVLQPNSKNSNYLYGRSRGHLINRRTAVSESLIKHPNGKVINKTKVHYHVITEKVFERIYKNFKIATYFDNNFNPYAEPLPLQNMRIIDNKLIGSLGRVLPHFCVGHFPDFPAMPAAILSISLVRAAGYLLKEISNQNDMKYIVRKGQLKAYNLAFAGEVIIIKSELLKSINNDYLFESKAITTSQKELGVVRIMLSLVNEY